MGSWHSLRFLCLLWSLSCWRSHSNVLWFLIVHSYLSVSNWEIRSSQCLSRTCRFVSFCLGASLLFIEGGGAQMWDSWGLLVLSCFCKDSSSLPTWRYQSSCQNSGSRVWRRSWISCLAGLGRTPGAANAHHVDFDSAPSFVASGYNFGSHSLFLLVLRSSEIL